MLTDRTAWGFAGALCYRRPVGWVLTGALAETSGLSAKNEFYMWHVRLPLFAPHNVLDLTFSERFGGGTATYTEGRPEELRQALASVVEAPPPTDDEVLPWLLAGPLENIRWSETTAYAAAYFGDTRTAQALLRRVVEHEPTYPWEQDLVERAAGIYDVLVQDDLGAARRRIATWRNETCRGLNLA